MSTFVSKSKVKPPVSYTVSGASVRWHHTTSGGQALTRKMLQIKTPGQPYRVCLNNQLPMGGVASKSTSLKNLAQSRQSEASFAKDPAQAVCPKCGHMSTESSNRSDGICMDCRIAEFGIKERQLAEELGGVPGFELHPREPDVERSRGGASARVVDTQNLGGKVV